MKENPSEAQLSFVELVCGVLANPVGVENTEVAALAANTLFSNCLVAADCLLLSDTEVAGLSEDAALADVSLAATSANASSVDDVALLGLVTELACLLRSRWLDDSVHDWELTILPSSDSENESDQLRLLLSPEFLQVLVRAHT